MRISESEEPLEQHGAMDRFRISPIAPARATRLLEVLDQQRIRQIVSRER